MRTCSKCEVAKPETDFNFRVKDKNERQRWCRECHNTHSRNNRGAEYRESCALRNKKKRARNMRMVWDYLKVHPCTLCGESDPVVLDFDHRDPATKKATVSSLACSTYGKLTILSEIAKCNVLCANCHRRKTAVQCGWYRNMAEFHDLPDTRDIDKRSKLSDQDRAAIGASDEPTKELAKRYGVHRVYVCKLRRQARQGG